MGFLESVGKGLGKLVVYGLESLLSTTNSTYEHRANYGNSDMSKEEMEEKIKKSDSTAEKMGIYAAMKDKGYRE